MQTETVLADRMMPLHELSERVLSSFHQMPCNHIGLVSAVLKAVPSFLRDFSLRPFRARNTIKMFVRTQEHISLADSQCGVGLFLHTISGKQFKFGSGT